MDLPLSQECTRVLAHGAEESERFDHRHIGASHLFLGLLREEQSFAAQLLRNEGLSLDPVREQVRQKEAPLAQVGSTFMTRFNHWLAERKALGGIWTVKQERTASSMPYYAVYVGDPPTEIDEQGGPAEKLGWVPLLCIEIIRDDRFSDVQKHCDGHISQGVAEIWILAPAFKRAYTVTKVEGIREFKGEILRISNPSLELDLKKIFS